MNRTLTSCSAPRFALLIVMALTSWSCAGSRPATGEAPGVTAPPTLAGTPSPQFVETRAPASPCIIPYFPPPSNISLCGEPVPLRNQEVLERFDKEFTMVVYNHAQVYLWLKRMERYFPWIEERLRANGLPEDLKYVAIVESDLLPDACSPKGAAGPWQFMPSTGSAYGLQQRGSCDERYDFERSTECAFRYLHDLYRRYRNWTVAIATYNCGDKRIQEQIRTLGATDYYQMRLPNETERYIFRILAVKTVLSDPSQYGYNLPKGQGYPPLKVARVNVQLTCPLPIQTVAEASGTTLREIKRLNPAFRSEEIPEGSHQIKVPESSADQFEKRMENAVRRSGPEENRSSGRSRSEPVNEGTTSTRVQDEPPAVSPAPVRNTKIDPKDSKPKQAKAKEKPPSTQKTGVHTVRKGETLSTIAARYKVSVEALRKANKLKSKDVTSGQTLVIP
jgi:LysM repeat protein